MGGPPGERKDRRSRACGRREDVLDGAALCFCSIVALMSSLLRRAVLLPLLLLAALPFAPQAVVAQTDLPPGDREHMLEELGVNRFTTPSIERVFQQLMPLRPIPFDKVWRKPPEELPPDRPRMALLAGTVIADGFLAVVVEKQSRLEPVGRALLRLARGLGVGDQVAPRSRKIIELAAMEKWPEVRQQLARAQTEAEAAMVALKDEEIAHLVALGGWLRGLEITAAVVAENPAPERARALVQPQLLAYFADRLGTLNPNLKATPLFQIIQRDVQKLKPLVGKSGGAAPTPDEVTQIHELAEELNRVILRGPPAP
jgi:hypothetical protein